jgi:hypothetical protein
MTTAMAGDVKSWATATSTHAESGRVIIFRFADVFDEEFDRSSLPDRVIIRWRYEDEAEKGMPLYADRVRMDEMEDLLDPVVAKDGFSVLALVSTGEHLREWIYYTRSEEEFLERLNAALRERPAFPIEILTARDPAWQTYVEFRSGLSR